MSSLFVEVPVYQIQSFPNTKLPKYKGIHCTSGSRNFRQGGGGGGGGGGGPGQSNKKSSDVFWFFWFFFLIFFLFLVLSLFYRSQNGQFQINLSFFKVPEGVHQFPGGGEGGPTFSRGGGVQLLIPYRNPYNL